MVSVGELLKKERVARGLTLKQIEKEIKIREKFLKAIESNEWNAFPSKIYVTGILKNYSNFLGLDPEKVTAFFRRDYERSEEVNFKRRVSSAYLTPSTKKLLIFSVVCIILFFTAYFAYQLQQFLSPPKVVIVSPTTSTFRAVDHIQITGKTEKEASITIYGERVYPNKDGVFTYMFPLKQGKNELIVEVVGANGKKTVLKQSYVKE
jgi:cytoskeletal protein RodZ